MTMTAIAEKKQLNKGKYIKKHNAAIRSFSEMSLLEKKVSNVLLYNAYNNLMTHKTHQITISQLLEMLSLRTNNYQKLKTAIKRLIATTVEWNVTKVEPSTAKVNKDGLFDSGENWKACSLLSSVQIDRTLITYEYNQILKDLFYEPAFYSKISLSVQNQFRSLYSISLYENAMSYLNCGTSGWLPLKNFRKLMGINESKYKNINDLKKRVLIPAMKEVNKISDIQVNYEIAKVIKGKYNIKISVSKNTTNPTLDPIKIQVSNDFLQKSIKNYKLPKEKISFWQETYGNEYLIEKIALIEKSKGNIKNPAAFLNKAIKENWGGRKTNIATIGVVNKQNEIKKYKFSKEENMSWFVTLNSEQKLEKLGEVKSKFPLIEKHLEFYKVDVLKEEFVNSEVFSIFMEVLARQ
jgi:plasmid replication initiation protein